ncbi:MAG: hypothetical protein JW855_03130 [Gammaproteobacteria bacterium]|nr:hypothetical protein [Gammaproteobacteria bacterium]
MFTTDIDSAVKSSKHSIYFDQTKISKWGSELKTVDAIIDKLIQTILAPIPNYFLINFLYEALLDFIAQKIFSDKEILSADEIQDGLFILFSNIAPQILKQIFNRLDALQEIAPESFNTSKMGHCLHILYTTFLPLIVFLKSYRRPDNLDFFRKKIASGNVEIRDRFMKASNDICKEAKNRIANILKESKAFQTNIIQIKYNLQTFKKHLKITYLSIHTIIETLRIKKEQLVKRKLKKENQLGKATNKKQVVLKKVIDDTEQKINKLEQAIEYLEKAKKKTKNTGVFLSQKVKTLGEFLVGTITNNIEKIETQLQLASQELKPCSQSDGRFVQAFSDFFKQMMRVFTKPFGRKPILSTRAISQKSRKKISQQKNSLVQFSIFPASM